ncbi:amine oxidase [flavin-containing] A-like [Osmia bicornis bicornis]|uniref:amine oxidase [flavin-containing] A-like n=1 Tax=Osmia bicornis bicornis TaxID=1437191 RepID=UPI001EAEFD15|nr:amine oxidase [flavin-containing] A-like [Osmia bicornis bicornis]
MAADFADEEFVREDANDLDVIIVGAGLTGLTCAYNILKKKTGLDVLIIEENNEVGGRILPKAFSETYHANFLQEHITDLIKTLDLNIDRRKIIDMRKRILCTNYRPSQNLPKYYGAEMEKEAIALKLSTNTMHNEIEHLAETSVEELLRKIVYFSFARSLCRAYICSSCAMRNLNDISVLWLLSVLNGALGLFNRLRIMFGDNNRYFIQGGVTKIAHELLENILRLYGKIRYAEVVNEIKFNDDRVYVLTEKNHFRCELVVIAVPPPMHNRIIIKPSSQCLLNTQILYIPSKNVFFNVTYKNLHWNDNSLKDVVTTWDSNSNLNIVYDVTRNNSERFMLSGFLAEPDSTQTNRKGLFNTLNQCFETVDTSKFLQYKEYNHFSNDQMKGGSPMSVMMPTSINNYINYMGTTFERIFFASSEYATNWPGTIDGAIEVGKMTAYSILYRIRPQVLTSHEIASLKYVFYIIVMKYYFALKINAPIPWKQQIFQNKNNQKIRASYLKFKQNAQKSDVEL